MTQLFIPPYTDLDNKPPRYVKESLESRRLQAIAWLGDKWCLAGTRQEFLEKLRVPGAELV